MTDITSHKHMTYIEEELSKDEKSVKAGRLLNRHETINTLCRNRVTQKEIDVCFHDPHFCFLSLILREHILHRDLCRMTSKSFEGKMINLYANVNIIFIRVIYLYGAVNAK